MNEIVNKFLLVEDKFMPEMPLKQPGFTYSACGPFTKNTEGIEKIIQAGNTIYIYKIDLNKACFQHDMDYGKIKKEHLYELHNQFQMKIQDFTELKVTHNLDQVWQDIGAYLRVTF